MVTTVQSALLTAEMDERQMAVLVATVCPWTGLAALGALAGAVVHAVLRDRSTLRSWLTTPAKAEA